MGYCMEQRDQDFFLPAEKKVEAFKHAYKKLVETECPKAAGSSRYGWVDDTELKNAKTIEDIFHAFRWFAEVDESGNITSIYFEGEKLGDDEQLFEAVALFVKKDSFIEMGGEDGNIWRWVFDGETCHEIPATITF